MNKKDVHSSLVVDILSGKELDRIDFVDKMSGSRAVSFIKKYPGKGEMFLIFYDDLEVKISDKIRRRGENVMGSVIVAMDLADKLGLFDMYDTRITLVN